MSNPRGEASHDDFLAAIIGGGDRASSAWFAARIVGECEPNGSRERRGGCGADVSHEDWLDAVLYGAPEPSARELVREYNFNPDEPRDERGRWTTDGSGGPPKGSASRPPDDVIAGPSATSGTAPTTTEWFERYIWGPLQRNGGTSYPKTKLQDVFFSGCIGLATLAVQVQVYPRDPTTGRPLSNAVPDVRRCFSSFEEARKCQEKLNKGNFPFPNAGVTLSGGLPRWRVFALLYSSKNETYPTAEPTRAADGSYDLTSNDVLLTIVDRSRPGATNFDFFTYSEPGDPWYNPDRPWIHADQGGKEKMELLATTGDGVLWEKAHNNSDFDKLFYFVACERQFPKAK